MQMKATEHCFLFVLLGTVKYKFRSFLNLEFWQCNKHNIHNLTGVGIARGSGINRIGVKRRTRYLRHFRRHFPTEVFLFWGIVCVQVGDSCSLLSGASLAFSSTVIYGSSQASFVVPTSIAFS